MKHKLILIREVKVEGKVHLVANALVGDDSGLTNLLLWDDEITQFKEGEVYEIRNIYAENYQGYVQLKIGKYSHFTNKVEEKIMINKLTKA